MIPLDSSGTGGTAAPADTGLVVTCHCEHTAADVKALRSYMQWRGFRWSFAATMVGCAGVGLAFGSALESDAPITALFVVVGWTAVLASGQLVNRANRALWTGTRFITLTDASVTVQSHRTWSQHRWSAFVRGVERPQHFFLLLSPVHGLIIPKRGFTSPEDVARARALLAAHTGR